jgi:hypothetical protein
MVAAVERKTIGMQFGGDESNIGVSIALKFCTRHCITPLCPQKREEHDVQDHLVALKFGVPHWHKIFEHWMPVHIGAAKIGGKFPYHLEDA